MRFSKGLELQTDVIVLWTRAIREDDLVVDFLTPDRGRLVGIARHGLKSRRRFGGVLEPFNFLSIRYQEKSGFVFLNEASITESMIALRDDLKTLLAAFHLVDLTRRALMEHQSDPFLYDLLKRSLMELKAGEACDRVVSQFELRFLEDFGWKPQLEKCLACGAQRVDASKREYYFVYREGGVFCASCCPPHLASDLFSEKSSARVIPRFIEYQLGVSLKSGRFILREGAHV